MTDTSLREHASFKCIEGNEKRMVIQAADMLEADAKQNSCSKFSSTCADTSKAMTPPLPEPERHDHGLHGRGFTALQMTEYGKACAAAEQDRIMRIVHEQANAYGKPGECMWIGIRAKVVTKAVSSPKTDWSAA